ncbi:IS110 family transposase [Streptomyces lunaelactis]|nr:IS110 family transposase [Streptomyces lunaelactis]NUK14657.1 IS110 family transposase [Streptomyces lunaelactis]NUK49682.1 IS110 family transposase [Streptomyces lunaelactis]NUK56120.1 IS110 family transposase [Streptomyces lunaelactis]NUK63521.1 IS110 family transposase [Streptomyces lunaelactis]
MWLLELLTDVLALAEDSPVTWAVDLNAGGGALLIALLVGHGQRLLYIPGRTVHHASRGYRGDGKTDAKDAYVIADQARMRRDLQPLQEWDEIAVDLKILTARRYDLAADRTRAINRLRAQLLEYFPALERAFDYAASKAALILLTGLPDSGRPAPGWRESAGNLAEEPQGSLRPGDGRCGSRCGAGSAHRRGWGGHGRGRGEHPGQGGAGAGQGDRGHRRADRGPFP